MPFAETNYTVGLNYINFMNMSEDFSIRLTYDVAYLV